MAADYTYDGAASIRGVAIRVTSLDANGKPDAKASCPTYITGGFIRFSFTPEYSDGDEIEIKNAAGEVCVYYKMPDTLKQVTFNLELCDPDPILTQKLAGGMLLNNTGVNSSAVIGYASEMPGVESTPNGVAIEVWANAIVSGKPAAGTPFFHYLFPWAQMRLSGERALENGNLATVFEGRGVGNDQWAAGPDMDLTGVSGAGASVDYAWPFPAPDVTKRPYAYARVAHAPNHLSGCFDLVPPAAPAHTSP